jgi:F-box domain
MEGIFPEEIWVMILQWTSLESYNSLSRTCWMMKRILTSAFIEPFVLKWRVQFLMPMFPSLILDDSLNLDHAKKLLCWIYQTGLFCRYQSDPQICFHRSLSKGCNQCISSIKVRGQKEQSPVDWKSYSLNNPLFSRHVLSTCIERAYPLLTDVSDDKNTHLFEILTKLTAKPLKVALGAGVFEFAFNTNTILIDNYVMIRRIFLKILCDAFKRLDHGSYLIMLDGFHSQKINCSDLEKLVFLSKAATEPLPAPIVPSQKRKGTMPFFSKKKK